MAEAPKFDSAMQKMQYETIDEFIKAYNGLVAKVNAATGDRDTLTENIKNSEEFADVRNKIAELMDQLDSAVAIRVEEALANASNDTEGLDEEIKDLKGKITAGLTFYKKLYGDTTLESLPKVDRVKGKGGGGGAGGKRIRGYNWIVKVGNEATEYENAASAAKALGLETSELQEQFFARAGVEQLKDAPDEVVFGLKWEDVDAEGNKTEVTAAVKAYRTGPSGPPAASTEDEDSDDEGDADSGVPVSVDEDELSEV